MVAFLRELRRKAALCRRAAGISTSGSGRTDRILLALAGMSGLMFARRGRGGGRGGRHQLDPRLARVMAFGVSCNSEAIIQRGSFSFPGDAVGEDVVV